MLEIAYLLVIMEMPAWVAVKKEGKVL